MRVISAGRNPQTIEKTNEVVATSSGRWQTEGKLGKIGGQLGVKFEIKPMWDFVRSVDHYDINSQILEIPR